MSDPDQAKKMRAIADAFTQYQLRNGRGLINIFTEMYTKARSVGHPVLLRKPEPGTVVHAGGMIFFREEPDRATVIAALRFVEERTESQSELDRVREALKAMGEGT